MTMQGLTQQPKRCRPSTTWVGYCSLIPLTAQTLPFQLSPVWSLKEITGGTKFEREDEVKSVVSDWLRHQSKDFYAGEVRKLVHKWKKCLKLMGDYVEKKLSFYLNYNFLC